ERRLNRAFSGFVVADFADEDHVGVVTQNAAQAGGEGQTDLRVHLDLADAFVVIFDGIFDGDDLDRLALDLVEAAVERGRFAGAGRASDQDDAVRQIDELPEHVVGVGQHADVGEVEDHAALVEQTHDDAFAVDHRDDRDANV